MKELKKAEIEIYHFDSQDFITTSEEHDNGFVDVGELMSLAKNIAEKIF